MHNKFGYNNFGYDNFSHKFRNHLVYNNFSQIFDFSRPLLLLFSWFILQVLAIFFKLYSPNSYFFFLVEQFTRALLSFDSSSEENVGASVLLTRPPLELKKQRMSELMLKIETNVHHSTSQPGLKGEKQPERERANKN